MSKNLKPVSKQVIVITGAFSGIGLATACGAAKRRAEVMLSSRNAPELERIVERIRADGGTAIHVVADVSCRDDLQNLADKTSEAFGGFDTWVSNAGLGIFRPARAGIRRGSPAPSRCRQAKRS